MSFQRWREDRDYFIPNDHLTLPQIPSSIDPIETIREFATSYDAAPGTRRYVRGCLPEDWDDSPKPLSRLRAVLYAGFHGLSWTPTREAEARKMIERIRVKVAQGDFQ